MKMLSDLHVIIKLRINHPTFGYLEVDKFQRIPSEITDRIVEGKSRFLATSKVTTIEEME